ncbi:MAG: hypothetical protein HOP07_02115 [Bacteriovoracaceae bacterium]|nr:hypothetical protein [Bacteriovoracaceae bacterium]
MKSLNYFLNHYEGLIVCTRHIDVPLDNNLAEKRVSCTSCRKKNVDWNPLQKSEKQWRII